MNEADAAITSPNVSTGKKRKEQTLRDRIDDLVGDMDRSGILYGEAVREFKKRFLCHVLERVRGNGSKAARELGMHRNTLSRTIRELDLGADVQEIRNRRP